MLRALGLALALALASGTAYAKDDDDDKVPAAEIEKVQATLTALGCTGYEEIKKEEQGIYEIDDAKCTWARSISSSTRTTPSSSSHVTDRLAASIVPQRCNRPGESALSRLAFYVRPILPWKMATIPLPSAVTLR